VGKHEILTVAAQHYHHVLLLTAKRLLQIFCPNVCQLVKLDFHLRPHQGVQPFGPGDILNNLIHNLT
jgi:hypothetical protein